MTEKLPVSLDKISNRLLPRKFYVRIKEYHPVLGSVFLIIWTGFWTILAVLINLLLLVIIVGTILLMLLAIFSDDSFDTTFLWLNSSSRKKNKKNEDRGEY
ncbi:MAG: hypothetical protein ACW99A_13480 [Candidatus Kariarchaeaceae archaeon]|jgi:hypothetical protein